MSSPSLSQKQREMQCGIYSGSRLGDFQREREHFSLKIWAIRLLAVFGTRMRTALRGKGFAWVPDLGSFLKLREVGVSPYLGFIHSLSILRMFE